ncbi:hypothetical protein LEMLEM_LOCUS12669 [Lemmus lemmus]
MILMLNGAAGRCIPNNYPPIGVWPYRLFTWMRKPVWPSSSLPFPLDPSFAGSVCLDLIFIHRSHRES